MKDKANKGYWQRLAKIYAPLMESDKKFYNAICGYIRDYLKSDMNPVVWNIPTKILYGDKDNLTSYETMSDFASKMGISLTVMNNGEHWFHTDEQMNFLDDWICESNR